MIYGQTRPGATAVVLNAGDVFVETITLAAEQRLVRAGAYVSGGGGSIGVQTLTPTLQDAAGNPLAAGDPVSVDSDDVGGWVALTFTDLAGLELAPGDYRVGLTAGETGGVAQAYRAGAAGARSIFLEALPPYSPPADVEDDYLAALPFEVAQKVLEGGTVQDSAIDASAGWHSPNHDPDRLGAYAIIRTGGPLEALVGDRLRVHRRVGTTTRSVVVWAFTEEVWPDEITDEDFSLTARAWLALADWPLDAIAVTVEVVA